MYITISTLATEVKRLKRWLAFYESSNSSVYENPIELVKTSIEEHEKAIKILNNYRKSMQWEDN